MYVCFLKVLLDCFTSAASGGAVSLETKSSGVFIANNSFILNHATGAGSGGHGGAVYASSTQSLMVSDTMVVDNVASSSGGGVFVQNADQTVVKDSMYCETLCGCICLVATISP